MKTAMQNMFAKYDESKSFTTFMVWLLNNEKELLEKEKEQMEDSYKEGFADAKSYDTDPIDCDFGRYFSKTYNK